MEIAYLGLGSNIGDKQSYLEQGIQMLSQQEGITVTKISSIYETAPWGYTQQDDFMNLVVEIRTELIPEKLLAICQNIETSLGRTRTIKWGPRTIDIDILLYGEKVVDTENLKIPHPYLLERDFVVVPLVEINPDLMIKEKTIRQWSRSL